MSSIYISHESPLCLLEKSREYNDYQYILPYFYKRYPEYKEFMDNYEGMTICDNGLFEGETYTIQEQLDLINETKCNTYIVQDEWNDSILTLKHAKYWMNLSKTSSILKDVNLMAVIQGTKFGEMSVLYNQLVDLGYTHFAFNHSSIAYQNQIMNGGEIHKAMIGRRFLIHNLFERNIIKKNHYIHLLGASNIDEFSYYNVYLPGVVNSIDTSNPVIKGIELEGYNEINKKIKSSSKMEIYFDKELDINQKNCILDNINKFKIIVNG